jgi:hypothetical protein
VIFQRDINGRLIGRTSDQRAQLIVEKNNRIKAAFGVAEDYVPGTVFESM